MPWSLEAHLERFAPHDRRLLLKRSALYAEEFKQRVFAGTDDCATTGEEILALTLGKIVEGDDGYAFREGDILLFYCLCRCCRKTILTLHRDGSCDRDEVSPPQMDEDTAPVLTERAAAQFLERRQDLARFLTFVGTKKLQGKQRAYVNGFHKFAAENWDEDQIARSLRTTPASVASYRSRLRELLEEFELQRVRAAGTQ